MPIVLSAQKVICVDLPGTIADWVIVEGSRIAGVGRGDPPGVGQMVEIEGVILPGLIDAHVHLTATGLFASGLDLRDARSVAGALEEVRRYVTGSSAESIIAGNFDPGRNDDRRMPTRHELDRVSEGRHLLVSRADGHSCTVNTATFERLGLDPLTEGIERDEHGEPTGILRGPARYEAGSRFFARLPESEIRRGHEAACSLALQRGVTAVHEMSQLQRDFEILISHRDELPIHIRPYLSTFDVGLVIGAGLNCIGGDLFLDGSLGSHTAALRTPYADAPDTSGLLYHSDDEIVAWLVESTRAGIQAAVHAIGDAAIEQALRCLEEAFLQLEPEGAMGARRLRHRIEHFEVVSQEQIERAARLGVAASVQPMFDRYWGGPDGMYTQRLGERARGMNPFSKIVGAAVTLAGGSDSTVTPLDPFLGMAAAVGHHRKDFAVSFEHALRMFTIWAAKAGHEEEWRGTIERGKLADFCVVAEDPAELEPDALARLGVLETWVAGERAWQS